MQTLLTATQRARLKQINRWFAKLNYAETRNHDMISLQQQVRARLPQESPLTPPAERFAAVWGHGWQPYHRAPPISPSAPPLAPPLAPPPALPPAASSGGSGPLQRQQARQHRKHCMRSRRI